MSELVCCNNDRFLTLFFFFLLVCADCASAKERLPRLNIKARAEASGKGLGLFNSLSRQGSDRLLFDRAFGLLDDLPSFLLLVLVLVCLAFGLFAVLVIGCKLQDQKERRDVREVSSRGRGRKRFCCSKGDKEARSEIANDLADVSSGIFDDSNIKIYFDKEDILVKYSSLFKDIDVILESKEEKAESDLSYIDISLNKV